MLERREQDAVLQVFEDEATTLPSPPNPDVSHDSSFWLDNADDEERRSFVERLMQISRIPCQSARRCRGPGGPARNADPVGRRSGRAIDSRLCTGSFSRPLGYAAGAPWGVPSRSEGVRLGAAPLRTARFN